MLPSILLFNQRHLGSLAHLLAQDSSSPFTTYACSAGQSPHLIPTLFFVCLVFFSLLQCRKECLIFSRANSLKGTYSSHISCNLGLIKITYVTNMNSKIQLFLSANPLQFIHVYKLSHRKNRYCYKIIFSKWKQKILKYALVFQNIWNQN